VTWNFIIMLYEGVTLSSQVKDNQSISCIIK